MNAAEKAETAATCGDAGGRTSAGTPCSRPAGWGVAAGSGPCRDHRPGGSGQVVGSIDGGDPPAPPDHLSEPAAARWRAILRDWVLSPSELLLLEEGLAAWDRVRACRATLREEGYVTVNPDSGNPKRHPLSYELDQSLSQLRQVFKQLDLQMPERP